MTLKLSDNKRSVLLVLPCAPTHAIFRSHVPMLRSGAERLPIVRNKQVYRVALFSFVTLIVAALVSAPLYQRSTSQYQPEPAHGDREPSRTRVTLCTQVLNEVRAVAASRAHQTASQHRVLVDGGMPGPKPFCTCVCRYPTCWNGSSSTRCKVRFRGATSVTMFADRCNWIRYCLPVCRRWFCNERRCCKSHEACANDAITPQVSSASRSAMTAAPTARRMTCPSCCAPAASTGSSSTLRPQRATARTASWPATTSAWSATGATRTGSSSRCAQLPWDRATV